MDQQVLNSIKQAKQNMSSINSHITQLEQNIAQEHNQLNNLTQQFQSHMNEMQQISQLFGDSFQQLDNCERAALSSTGQQFSSSYTSPNYTGYSANNTNYNQQASLYSGHNRQNTGYSKQFYPSQNAATVSMNTRDKDIGPGYYNMQNNANQLYGSTSMNNTAQTANQRYTGSSPAVQSNMNNNAQSASNQYAGTNTTGYNNINNTAQTANQQYTGSSPAGYNNMRSQYNPNQNY